MTAQTSAPLAADPPRAAGDLVQGEFAGELRALRTHPLFWVGVTLKVSLGVLFGSHFATRWFAPFAYEFVHGHFADPWAVFLARGEPMAFPYGPAMLLVTSLPFAPAFFASFEPASHLGLLLLRLPLFAADLTICVLLMRWLRVHARDAIVAYWLSPVVLYATYVHGQLDLIPTALLCLALFLMFARRTTASALVFGAALATKAHLLVALPFALVYLFRTSRRWSVPARFGALTLATTLAFYAVPLTSGAFRAMVLGSAEAKKIWSVVVPYGANGLVLYVAPAAVAVALLRFASYRKVNRELTLMFVGALYVGLVALVPPQPGWFIWSIPFVAYLGARFTRIGRFTLLMLSAAYVAYFFAGDPEVFLEALDPTFGRGFGAAAAARLAVVAPALVGPHAASVAWTFLFSATALAGFEMYRKGVRSNSIYRFREQSFMIGIGGDSGAGKHTLAADVAALLGPQLSSINGDDDHKWERGHAMWRRYTHLDPRGNMLGAQLEGLAALRRGGDVRKRHYDHDRGRFTQPLLIRPNDFVAIVGLHPFYLPSQRQLLDLKVFVDPPEDVRRTWKVDRDMQKRGYSREQVLEQIEKRMADSVRYVQPQKKYADVVLRQCGVTRGPSDLVDMEIELVARLDPLVLVEALDAAGLRVEWEPDDELTRDVVRVRGEADLDAVRALGTSLLPNAEELVVEEGWRPGGRGIAQVAILHALSVELRRGTLADAA